MVKRLYSLLLWILYHSLATLIAKLLNVRIIDVKGNSPSLPVDYQTRRPILYPIHLLKHDPIILLYLC